jgi:hypothetical protein
MSAPANRLRMCSFVCSINVFSKGCGSNPISMIGIGLLLADRMRDLDQAAKIRFFLIFDQRPRSFRECGLITHRHPMDLVYHLRS